MTPLLRLALLVQASDPLAASMADRIVTAHKARSKRVAVKKAPSRKAKADKRSERNERMAYIRATVMVRENHRCELCQAPATEVHHLLSGPLRRIKESVETCVALCARCHGKIHRNDPDALDRLANYCTSCGMHEASSALHRRLDKIHESSRTGPGMAQHG